MDFDLPTGAVVSIVIGVLISAVILVFWFVMIVLCCIKRKSVYKHSTDSSLTPVVVTSATHIGPGGYPVTQLPVGATNTTYQTQAYTAPYPPQGIPAQMPMPMPMPTHPPVAGVQPHLTMPATSMNPPSYDVAVSGAGAGQSNSNVYQQQPPYNPNYGM